MTTPKNQTDKSGMDTNAEAQNEYWQDKKGLRQCAKLQIWAEFVINVINFVPDNNKVQSYIVGCQPPTTHPTHKLSKLDH